MASTDDSVGTRQRARWVDTLRVVLISGVIVVHTATPRGARRCWAGQRKLGPKRDALTRRTEGVPFEALIRCTS